MDGLTYDLTNHNGSISSRTNKTSTAAKKKITEQQQKKTLMHYSLSPNGRDEKLSLKIIL
jgi:hypothetical protein